MISPTIKASADWGDMGSEDASKSLLFTCLDNLVTSIEQGISAVDAQVKLPELSEAEAGGFTVDTLRGPADIKSAAEDPIKVQKIELLVGRWCDQISRVLAVNDQIRSEPDDAGPQVELAHWKQRTAIFNSLADSIKDPRCIVAINVLRLAKSKVIARWKLLDTDLTSAANESKDNVKYLRTLSEVTLPLYGTNLAVIEEVLPSIMHAVGNIHSCSSYYNTSEHMTALFIKVTNQLIKASREFVYQKEPRIWEHGHDELVTQLATIRSAHAMYRSAFQSEKERLQRTPDRNQFDFPAMGVFGKSDAFMGRVDRVERMYGLMTAWKGLQYSKIDGIEAIWTQAKGAIKAIRAPPKPYDPLDIRKLNFEGDSEHFFNAMADAQSSLQGFCTKALDGQTVSRRLHLLRQFEKVAHLGLNLEVHYLETLMQFGNDLESVRRSYTNDRESPPIPRNLPPLAGRIAWAKNLFKRIAGPMDQFQELCPELLRGAGAPRKLIKLFNKTGKVLAEFENICYAAFRRAVDMTMQGLSGTVLVTNAETGKIEVNADPQVMQLAAESSWMMKLDMGLTENAELLVGLSGRFKDQASRLNAALTMYDERLRKQVPERLTDVLGPMRKQLLSTFNGGLQEINWFSVKLPAFIAAVNKDLEHMAVYLGNINDLLTVRIDAKFKELRTTSICAMPGEGELWTCEEFEANSEELSVSAGKEVEHLSYQIERSVDHLIEAVEMPFNQGGFWVASTVELGTENYETARLDLKKAFVTELSTTLTKCVRNSLDVLKRKSSEKRTYGTAADAPAESPIVACTIRLTLPTGADITPSLDVIQNAVVKASMLVVTMSSSVLLWGQDRAQDASTLKNHHTMISTNKEITRTLESIGTAVNATKGSIDDILSLYDKYNDLWLADRSAKMTEFGETKPDLSSFTEEVSKYEKMEVEVDESRDKIAVGAIMLLAEDFKLSLTSEITIWKADLSKLLNQKTAGDMQRIFNFSDDLLKKLGRNIADLEDVRLAMTALKDLREQEIELDALMAPIEAGYAMLAKNNVSIDAVEQERLDSMRFQWNKMTTASIEIGAHLVAIQPEFKKNLVGAVASFQGDQRNFISDYNIKGPMCEGIKPSEASDRLAVFEVRFTELWKRFVTYNGGEGLFGLVQSEYPQLQNIKKELNLLTKLYSLYNDVTKSVQGYYDIKWTDVDTEAINAELLNFGNRCRKLPKALKEWDAYLELQKVVDDFNETLPLLEAMSSKTMLPRHWARITEVCKGHAFDVANEAFELRGIMEAPLLENKDEIEDICIASVKEQDIEAKLALVVKEWSAHEIAFKGFKSRGELKVNNGVVGELVVLMEDSLMVLSGLMSNRYNPPYRADIQKWVRNLSDSTEIVEKWMVVQNLWEYLEAVFVGGDIAKQLPKEAKRFANIDKSWVKLMGRAHENLNLVQCCVGDETMANVLPHLLEQLEVCQKSLTGYLEKKRLVFPRFFFVSDPVLLEILGQASDSHTIQDHLLNLFDNMKEV